MGGREGSGEKGRELISPLDYELLRSGALWEPSRDGKELGEEDRFEAHHLALRVRKDHKPCVQISPGGKLRFCPGTVMCSVVHAGWRLHSNGLDSRHMLPLLVPEPKNQ